MPLCDAAVHILPYPRLNLRVISILRYHSPVQGLSGKQWARQVSDSEAAALLREDPNFIQGSLTDSDEATAQQVQLICAVVKHSLSDPIIKQAWADAWRAFGRLSFGDETSCCWWYARYVVKFAHHQELLRAWLFKFDDLQLIISPDALLRMMSPKGACATFTALIGGMLQYRGIPWEIVAAAVNPMVPDLYTHVWPQAVRPDGSRIALDASHGKYPGWHAPDSRVIKKKYGTPMAMKSQEVN